MDIRGFKLGENKTENTLPSVTHGHQNLLPQILWTEALMHFFFFLQQIVQLSLIHI